MMPAATFPILVNICVSGMFVGGFLTIAQLNPGFRHLRWIALTFAVGMITPIADFLLPFSAWPLPFIIASDAGLFLGLVLMVPALAMLYRRPAPWGLAGALVLLGLVMRLMTWGGSRGTFGYEISYQTPFAAVALCCAVIVFRHGNRTVLDYVAGGLFATVSAHFLIKPFVAVHLGSGATASEYADTTYAMISQVSSGILLVAAGLVVMINALQMVIQRDRAAALSDHLTGLPNRRALEQAFESLSPPGAGHSPAIAVIDLDHFKMINDRWGHDAGDDVLRAVANCMHEHRPSGATIFRHGGEEFVLLIPRSDAGLVRLACEKLRLAVGQLSFPTGSRVTVSIGATTVSDQEDLSAALRRADHGLYAAKAAGRDRCVFEQDPANGPPPGDLHRLGLGG